MTKYQSKGVECPIAMQARTNPDASAIAVAGDTFSYAEFHRHVTQLSEILPYECGERICFQSPNTAEHVALVWALLRCGVIAVPISTRLTEEQAQLRVDQVNGRLHSDKPRTDDNRAATTQLDLDRPATIIFSSGTTGQPKAVVHDLRSHFCSAEGSNSNLPLTVGDRWLLSLPTYHVGGLSILFRCALAGACVAIPEKGDSIVASTSKLDVTHISVVPTQLQRMLDAEFKLSQFPTILLGGSVLPASLISNARLSGFSVYATYGLTEMASQVTTTSGSPDEPISAGRPLEHRELKVAKDGEILVRGATLCRGYWRNGKIENVVDKDGWFHTKDIGEKTEDGSLSITGRMDNMFISGGENIYPEEIERCLLDLPGVRQAIVVAVPDPEFGHRPVAVVEGNWDLFRLTSEGMSLNLPKFKIPEVVYPWPKEIEPLGIKPDRQRVLEWVLEQRE